LPAYTVTIASVKIRAEKAPGSADGRVDAKASFDVPPAFSSPPPFTLRIRDGGALDVSHTFASCTTKSSGKIDCREEAGEETRKESWRATLTPHGAGMRLKTSLRGQAVDAPFAGPATIELLHNSAVVRTRTIAT